MNGESCCLQYTSDVEDGESRLMYNFGDRSDEVKSMSFKVDCGCRYSRFSGGHFIYVWSACSCPS